ncbi:adhesion G-protein coupled receptor G6-like isoform X3 [Patiria miniata]|nr:adhesion G-protein coupled receptor G6-like isoform X3 [Patiria miniata]
MQISVLVSQPPVITCPPNQTIQTDPKQNFATVTLPEPASASDNSGWFEITIDADGSTRRVNGRISLSLAQSRHTLQYTARDASNNFATCTMQITVIDLDPPIMRCPGDIHRLVDFNIGSVAISWPDVRAADPNTPLLWNSSHHRGDMFPVGNVTMVTYTVADQGGNVASCNFTVTVTTGVELRCPANITTATNPGSKDTFVSWAMPQVIFSSLQGQGTRDMRTHLDHVSSGSGSFFNFYGYSYTVDDDDGSGSDGDDDDDDGTPIRLLSENLPGDAFSIGSTPVSYRIEGTEIECNFLVIVEDNEPPTFDDCPADVTIPVGSSSNQVHHRWIPPMASDNSGREVEVTFSCSGATADDCDQAGKGTFSVGDSKMTYRAEDASGNENVCTVTVTVVKLVCPANFSALATPDSTSTSVSWSEPDLTGWNGPTNFTSSNNSGVELLIGAHRVDYQQWFAAYNLHLECSFFVVVQGQCPTNTTNDGLRWPVAVAGSTAKSVQRCPLTTANAGEPEAVRNCSKLEAPLYFRWEEQETRGCGDKKKVSLENVVKVEVSKGNAVEVAEFLANQTSESSKEAEDVAVVASILENIARAGSGDKEVTELVLETVSNVIMSVGPETPDSEPTQIEAGTSSAIIQSVETQISLTLQQEGKVSIRQDSIHVEAVSLEPNQTRNGLSFVSVKQSNVTSPGQGSLQEGTLAGSEVETLYSSMIPKDLDVLASARLPGNITNLLPSPDAQLQASFLIYADDTLFQSASIREHRGEGNSTRKVAGSVVSLTVENVELVNLTEPVVIEFKEESSEVHCVSWDFELEDGVGDWTTDGCALAEVTNKTVVCNCSHATNFAILVDVKGQAPDDKDDTPAKQALDIISHVGAALSIIALAITLIIYLAIRKLRSGKSRQIFINFCFSLFMLYIVFVAGVDNAKGSGGGCVFVAALLHYLTLSTMMWMAVEARNMYVSTVKVFPEDTPRYMLKACLIAWGSPLIVLIITLAAASHHYANEHYCFVEPGLVLYLGLLVPIGLILLHNIITFILVMRSLLKVKEVSRSQQISKRLQNAVGISALMGLTWCFGFLAINEAAFAFQLIFCLANSLQGVVVFIMFCARREEVRTALAPYMKRICCGRECRLPTLHPEKSNESELVSATAHTQPSTGQTAEVEISVTTPQ